jgi:predicted nucleic acid-binding Zn ribbon protein
MINCPVVQAVQKASMPALRELLAGQPTTAGKVAFAWQVAAGPAMGRAARVTWMAEQAALRVTARDAAWLAEIRRARPIVLERLQGLLGAGVVDRLIIEGPAPSKR